MPASASDIHHLAALIEAARDHAGRVGQGAARTTALLDEALATARSLAADGGRPDEGLRPNQLTTDNDE